MSTNLHVHTHYSTLDGMCKIDELVARAKELGQNAIAITDHGNMCGVYDLYKQCKKQDVQPIYGIEFYHQVEGYKKRFHIIAFAKTMKGLQNLYKLHELSFINSVVGSFGKRYPVITYDDLFKYKEDVIVTSACLAGYVPYLLQNEKYEEAYKTIEMLQAQFKDDFYIEYQANTLSEQNSVNTELYSISQVYKIKTILTCDTHYIHKEDAIVHEMLLCMQTQDKMNNPQRFKFSTRDYWLKSEDEMRISTRGLPFDEIDKALANTDEIAQKCCFELEMPKIEDALPKYSDDEKRALRDLCNVGWKEKKHARTQREMDRANYELDIIESKGYSGYYLIVADYINWAKSNNIVVGAGRGSGVGSFIAYLTGMTSINPLDYGLLFERFLNPERYTSPDFDVDFSDRESVVEYLKQRWKSENTSAIIAFGTLTAKAVIRKVLSIHGFTMAQINEISKSLPKKLELTLSDCEASDVFCKYKKQYPDLFQAMYRLEGTIDHVSQHAAGVLITPNAISNFVPALYDANTKMLVSGFDKYMLEDLGWYKFDILKLTTLTVLDDAIKLIKQNKNIDIDLDAINYEDKNVYADLCNGSVFGVFQLEDQSDMTRKLQPKNFEAITALNALIRPGIGDVEMYAERMKGSKFKYYSDLEKPYMQPTFNIITYQEQFMMRVKTLAGWTLGKGDSLRKVKRIRDNVDLAETFLSDCKTYGVVKTKQDAENAWKEIVDALEGGYSFNKSHACSYAKISFGTAWLKHYYPLEFMTALMTSEREKQDKIAERVNQCKLLNIKILPPDINKSTDLYTIEDNAIRFAINTIKGVGDNALNAIREIGYITSLNDLFLRGNLRVIDKTVVTNLIKSGCFDFENTNRYELLEQYHMLRKEKKLAETYKNIQCNSSDVARFERETLGLYLTASPFDGFNFKPLDSFEDGGNVLIAGEVTSIKTIFDKKNNKMAFVTLATQTMNVELIVFAKEFNKLQTVVLDGNFVKVSGKKDKGKVLVNNMEVLMI